MTEYDQRRWILVERQLAGRGLDDARLLNAFRAVPRERFVAPAYRARACEDCPVPDAEGGLLVAAWDQATRLAALAPGEDDRVLIAGSGGGYVAALLARLAAEVWAVEGHAHRAESARRRLGELGEDRVRIRVGEPDAGWPAFGPYDRVLVTAPTREPPRALLAQLRVGGRLVVDLPGGPARFVRTGESTWAREELDVAAHAPVVPVGAFGAPPHPAALSPAVLLRAAPPPGVARSLRDGVRPFTSLDDGAIDALADRLADARVVLLGESTHGTAEFYRARARITLALVDRGFDLVALEADWSDAASLDRRVRGLLPAADAAHAFTRFPTWMWRNAEMQAFVEELRARAALVPDPGRRPRVVGLDLFSLHRSLERVVAWLAAVDPAAAARAGAAYAALTAWEGTPAWQGGWRPDCAAQVAMVLDELRARAAELAAVDPEGWAETVGDARLVVAAERYHREVVENGPGAWNAREDHMLATLAEELARRGGESRAVVWAHNSHVGDALATDLARLGQHSLGELARARWGGGARLVGLGTFTGEVVAAPAWDAASEVMALTPALPSSHERVCHDTGHVGFVAWTGPGARAEVLEALGAARLQRAVGVVYEPGEESTRNYLRADLAAEFDAWLWIDRTHAVRAGAGPHSHRDPETWPSGL